LFNKNPIEFSSGYFGKLPEFNDFIKYNAGSPEILFIDNWLQEGLAQAKIKFKTEWKGKYFNLQPTEFFLSVPSSEKVTAGMLYAGNDKSNREFPFIIFSILPGNIFNKFYLIPAALQQMLSVLDDLLRKEEDVSSLNNALKNYRIVLPPEDSLNQNFNEYLLNTKVNQFLIRTGLSHCIFNLHEITYSDSSLVSISLGSDENHFNFDAGFLIYLLNEKMNLSFRHSSVFWNRTGENKFRIIIFPFKLTSINFLDLLEFDSKDTRLINLNSHSGEPSKGNNLLENTSLKEVITKKKI